MKELNTTVLLSYAGTLAEALLETCEYPWQALPQIGQYINKLIATIDLSEFNQMAKDVFIHKSVSLAANVSIAGPTIIDAGTEVRPGAYIRGNALIGKQCVIGNSCEIKNSILIEKCQVPHFNYVGDSILGVGAHLGAGSIASNLKSDKSNVTIRTASEKIATGLRKFGAILGDYADVGCNSVLTPGSVVGQHTRVYPLSFVRGYVPAHSIYKTQGEVTLIRE